MMRLIHLSYGTIDNVVETDARWFDRSTSTYRA